MVSADTMQVTVTGQDSTWVGIGYGWGMMGTDMNIVEFTSNGSYTLTDAYSVDEVSPNSDANQGGKNDLTGATYTRNGSSPQVVFQRKLNTGDSKDKVLSIVIIF
jgi:hypothetical protein